MGRAERMGEEYSTRVKCALCCVVLCRGMLRRVVQIRFLEPSP